MTPKRSRRARARRGYTVLLVTVFLVVLTATLGMTYRRITTALRIEAARVALPSSDDALLNRAAAEAMGELMKDNPRTDPFTVQVPLYPDRPDLGVRTFVAVVARDTAAGSDRWTLQVAPMP